jgi:cytosine/adenosine deaminase-related metal-dependent hydrolase
VSERVRLLPTEVELAIQLQPCLAERRTYEVADAKHPCEFFADQGSFHAFDLRDPGPPQTSGALQPVHYAGRRRVTPEMLSGCRKAPIMAVGINPNLPAYWTGKHNSLLPTFDDILQYAHHYRYRSVGKLQIRSDQYQALRKGRTDDEVHGDPLVETGTPLDVELADQAMYVAYASLLEGLATAMGWSNAALAVGEDLSYGNMVACGSPRWITRPDRKYRSLPVMTEPQRRGIVAECFFERKYFLRQLMQSLPHVLLVFGSATRDAFVRAMGKNFVEGAPQLGEDLATLLARRIILRYGVTQKGEELTARVLFVPHASGNPTEFAAVRDRVVACLVEEARQGRLELDAATGHLRRPAGDCAFCGNALYRIGPCEYRAQLVPLAGGVEETFSDGSPLPPEVRERAVQERLLDQFMPSRVESSGREEAASGGAPVRHVLIGRVVTMKDDEVLERAAVYIHDGAIEAIRDVGEGAPDGYEDVHRVDTRGTLYPGLIDLHNHVAYNVLPPWTVPRAFGDRNQWRRARDYAGRIAVMRRLASGNPARAVARYVEVKALVGGVTTLQGMRSSFATVSGAMRGLVRNVETAGDHMPRAGSAVIDLDPRRNDAVVRFREAVQHGKGAFFYHLSEGVNEAARRFWHDLVEHDLLGPRLVGIHCLGVPPGAYGELAETGGSVVWSPTSNLMLYGSTLPLKTLLESGVAWALGCDWSVSGAKNPLFELKVARAVADQQGVRLRARDLVAAVTTRAASVARWHDAIGTLAPGFRADVIVLDGADRDPYEQLIEATEASIVLSLVDGVVRVGTAELFDELGMPEQGREVANVGSREQMLWLREPGTPLDKFRLDRAIALLEKRMGNTDETTEEAAEDFDPEPFQLLLDDEMAPLPPEDARGVEEAAAPIPQPLDALTVLDEKELWSALENIEHFPLDVAELRKYYR